MNYLKFNHDKHAKTCKRDDFWVQIRRTVNSTAITQEQIKLVVDTIVKATELNTEDTVLALCCGNVAVSSRVSQNCCYISVIYNSEYLISTAKELFKNISKLVFHKAGIKDFIQNAQISRSNVNKILCYGSTSCLNSSIIRQIFDSVNAYLPSVSHFSVGNMPKRSKSSHFFKRGNHSEFDIESHTMGIGKWWVRDEVNELAKEYSRKYDIRIMPNHYSGSSYRFESLLSR